MMTYTWGKNPPTVDENVDFARAAEELGFDSVHMPWHYTLPHAMFSWGNRHCGDPLVSLAAMADGTEALDIYFNRAIISLLHPYVWAKYISSLDVVSNGRTIPVFEAGWWADDFQVGMASVEDKKGRFGEALEVILHLWKGEEITEIGQFWDARGLQLDPRPVRHSIWIGGGEDEVETAARVADGLNPIAQTPAQMQALRNRLTDEASRHGRRVGLAMLAYLLIIDKSDDPSHVRDHLRPLLHRRLRDKTEESAVVGTPEECAQQIERLFDAGTDYLLFDVDFHRWESHAYGKEQARRLAESVIPLVRNAPGLPERRTVSAASHSSPEHE